MQIAAGVIASRKLKESGLSLEGLTLSSETGAPSFQF
jgi:hypothetical protein